MPALEDALADLAAHPPVDPTPVVEIQGRARRRTRRRRATIGVAAVLAVVAAGLGVGAVVSASSSNGDGSPVVADGGRVATTSSSTTTSSAPATDPGLALEPASALEEGSVVEMTLTDPAVGDAVVAQCASEALEAGADLEAWCTAIEETQADALLPYSLTRTLDTPVGRIDCAASAGRCVLVVRLGGLDGTDDRWAPLSFRTDLGPIDGPEVVVDGDEGTVGDGEALLVTLTGVSTGQHVTIRQCRTEVPAHLADTTGWQCDGVRSREVDVEDGPETQLTFTAFHDVYVNDAAEPGGVAPRWAPCEPCELQVWVGAVAGPVARLPLVMEPTDAPVRPTIALDPASGHVAGGTVRVHATGLQPATSVAIGWCLLETAQGGGGSPCSGPVGPMQPNYFDVDEVGSLTIPDLELPRPDQESGQECLAVPGTCGVGIDSGDGSTTVAIAPLDLTG